MIEDIIRGYIGFDGLLMSDDSSMNALKGTLGERAKAIAENGCDIVLHCNGVMDEMLQVVEAAKPLEGKARERAKRVEAAFGKIDGLDGAAVRAEFNALLPVA